MHRGRWLWQTSISFRKAQVERQNKNSSGSVGLFPASTRPTQANKHEVGKYRPLLAALFNIESLNVVIGHVLTLGYQLWMPNTLSLSPS